MLEVAALVADCRRPGHQLIIPREGYLRVLHDQLRLIWNAHICRRLCQQEVDGLRRSFWVERRVVDVVVHCYLEDARLAHCRVLLKVP